jgi:hypothetical protein
MKKSNYESLVSNNNMRDMMDNELRNMRDMIDALLTHKNNENGIDVTPVFRMAKANMIQNYSEDLRLAVILGRERDIEEINGLLNAVINMNL